MPDNNHHDVRWIDSHAHLTMFEPDEVPEVLERARAAGVRGVLVPATGRDDLDLTLELAVRHPTRIAAAVGVHPHEASALDGEMKRSIRCALAQEGVVAVGEIGLDYHYMSSPKEDQLAACEWQLDLAVEADLPVVIHNRESWNDLEALLAPRGGSLRGVCHSFTEGADEARRVIDLGLMVGISGMVTFKAADNIRSMVVAVDLDHLLVETDSPYLAPVPHRGRRNEPQYVVDTGNRVAQELGESVATVAAATSNNFRHLFAVTPDWGEGA
jgi:TatD DNase family protein